MNTDTRILMRMSVIFVISGFPSQSKASFRLFRGDGMIFFLEILQRQQKPSQELFKSKELAKQEILFLRAIYHTQEKVTQNQ